MHFKIIITLDFERQCTYVRLIVTKIVMFYVLYRMFTLMRPIKVKVLCKQ